MAKCALLLGLTGQIGSYLARLLLDKGYEVHGVKRRTSTINTVRIDDIFDRLAIHYGDIQDESSLARLLAEIHPDEIYNLAAQSHVGVSFELPRYTFDVTGAGPLRLLEAIRASGLECRVFQASSSEMFGDSAPPQSEDTPFRPRSPYAVAKLAAYWLVRNYREAYGVWGANGILFNTESPVRGETFVTRKITRGLARIKLGLQGALELGNLEARRDWSHARDIVEGIWRIMQHDRPDDFILASGRAESVRWFLRMVAEELDMDPMAHVAINDRYLRPTEVESLRGDATKARETLGWAPMTTLEGLVREMARADLALAKKEATACASS